MKKAILLFLVLYVLARAFAQTTLVPKKKVISPQFEKFAKYGLANSGDSVFMFKQYGIPVIVHFRNDNEGILFYALDGDMRTDERILNNGTIVAGFRGSAVETSFFIFDYSDTKLALALYEAPAGREFLLLEKTQFEKDALIERIIEGQTELKWIRDEL